MSHGKRNQKAFRRGSLRRKIANQQIANQEFSADTDFVAKLPTEPTEKQRLAILRSNEIRAQLEKKK
jgi:hypothetical protein